MRGVLESQLQIPKSVLNYSVGKRKHVSGVASHMCAKAGTQRLCLKFTLEIIDKSRNG